MTNEILGYKFDIFLLKEKCQSYIINIKFMLEFSTITESKTITIGIGRGIIIFP